ncbi:MAG: hypothetical protein LQ340_001111 [Diploschistes diacapsis]|nr:MAG: hypothetical protein LQ340_001111 [Diploschistes diacapsis]
MSGSKATATVNGRVIAEADSWQEVEGNIYFPFSSVDKSILTPTEHSTHCPWKGDASYYNIGVDGENLENAAWYYAEPLDKAKHIKDHVAFYKTKVQVTKS